MTRLGRRYVDSARAYIRRGEEDERITFLPERDIEHCFWANGHAATIVEVAGLPPAMADRVKPTQAIAKAVQRKSKPFLALRLVESVAAHGPRACRRHSPASSRPVCGWRAWRLSAGRRAAPGS